MRTKTVLKKARTRLEGHWTKEKFERVNAALPFLSRNEDNSLVCAIGALNWAVGADVLETTDASDVPWFRRRSWQKAFNLLSDCVYDRVGHYSVIGYNDRPSTTEQDILEIYDCAIEKA